MRYRRIIFIILFTLNSILVTGRHLLYDYKRLCEVFYTWHLVKFYNEFYDKMTTYKMPYPDAIDLIASVKRLQPKNVQNDITVSIVKFDLRRITNSFK